MERYGHKKENAFLDVKVKVIYGGGDDILSQYLEFTRVFKEKKAEYGPTREAVIETINQGIDRGILAKYLEEKKDEVIDIMFQLFDDEYIREMTERSIKVTQLPVFDIAQTNKKQGR